MRKDLAHGDAQLRPGLQNAEPGLAEREVLPIAAGDQVIEHRIVEDVPPGADVDAVRADADVVGVDPLLFDRRRRRAVIRSDLEAVGEILAKTGASAGWQQQRRRQYRQPEPMN